MRLRCEGCRFNHRFKRHARHNSSHAGKQAVDRIDQRPPEHSRLAQPVRRQKDFRDGIQANPQHENRPELRVFPADRAVDKRRRIADGLGDHGPHFQIAVENDWHRSHIELKGGRVNEIS